MVEGRLKRSLKHRLLNNLKINSHLNGAGYNIYLRRFVLYKDAITRFIFRYFLVLRVLYPSTKVSHGGTEKTARNILLLKTD